jgi:hypothetical protein
MNNYIKNKLNFVDDFFKEKEKEKEKQKESINNTNNNNYNFLKKFNTIKNTTIKNTNQNFNTYIENKDVLFTKLYTSDTNEHKMCKINNDILDILDNFILIIDFPNFGGGTTFFLNTIVTHFKNNNVFIIARNFNNMLQLSINDEYELINKYNTVESIHFLNEYKNKINKIFVNHTINHNKDFLNELFLINKKTTLITHDYYSLFNKAQPYFEEFEKLSINNKALIDINNYDLVISQNECNLNIFSKYYNNKIYIVELPDFKKKDKLIINNTTNTTNISNTSNTTNIIVGIIGAISIIKGRDVLEKIINFFDNSSIKIIVFGDVNINNFHNFYKYNSISDLNLLLIKHKPNILLELSLWPETYSYSLSISMLTDLPIIYLKKPFLSVIEKRLSTYKKAHSFKNIQELKNLIINYNQNYYYTIEENIYFDNFWNAYFSNSYNLTNNVHFNNINNKNIVLITSKIYVSKNPFSYVNNRSCYTPQQRLQQTFDTIKSIRKFIPDSYIILIDNSKFNYFECMFFKNTVDIFINITDNEFLNFYTDIFEYKAFAEISQQIHFFKLFLKNDYSKIKNFFKISGRYLINEDFCYNNYDNDYNIFKKNIEVLDREYYYTCFYKLDKSILEEVNNILMELFNNKTNYMNNFSDLEVIFPNKIINKIKLIDKLGIVENIGVWEYIKNI